MWEATQGLYKLGLIRGCLFFVVGLFPRLLTWVFLPLVDRNPWVSPTASHFRNLIRWKILMELLIFTIWAAYRLSPILWLYLHHTMPLFTLAFAFHWNPAPHSHYCLPNHSPRLKHSFLSLVFSISDPFHLHNSCPWLLVRQFQHG